MISIMILVKYVNQKICVNYMLTNATVNMGISMTKKMNFANFVYLNVFHVQMKWRVILAMKFLEHYQVANVFVHFIFLNKIMIVFHVNHHAILVRIKFCVLHVIWKKITEYLIAMIVFVLITFLNSMINV